MLTKVYGPRAGLLDRAHARVQALFRNLDAARFDRLSGQFLLRLLTPDVSRTRLRPLGRACPRM
ncbi:MAG: hypothetical protein WKG07_32600 [Hymenobacter sp.]